MLGKDLGFAARTLRRSPAFALTAVVTLALGIGATTALFSVVNGVLLRPLPYADPDRLVLVWGDMRARNYPDFPFPPGDFPDVKEQGTLFEDIAGVATFRLPLTGDNGEPEQVRAAGTTTNLFTVLGTRIALGRNFTEADGVPEQQAPPAGVAPPQVGQAPPPPQLPAIAILSHEFWQRRYGGDRGVIGRSITLGNQSAEVVGVLAPGFELLFPPSANIERTPDVFVAMRLNFEGASRINALLRVIGRLKPGVTVAQSQAQMDKLAADLRERFPIKKTADLHIRVEPMHEDLIQDVRPAILALMGAVTFVLLIACANVANLMLVRMARRERELAVRAALGGSRERLVKQMLAESLLIAGAGAALGLFLAWLGVGALLQLAPARLPRMNHVGLDPVVLAFTAVAGLLAAAAFGVVPALRASRPDIMQVLRTSGRTGALGAAAVLRNAVVTAEVALSFILLIGCGLMLRSFVVLQNADPGFDPNGVLTFQIQNPRLNQPEQRRAFQQQLQERFAALRGVQAVTAANPLPLEGVPSNMRWGPPQAVTDASLFQQADLRTVLPGYFQVMRTRLIAGRDFTEADNNPDAKTLIIDEVLAAKAFPGRSAVGERLFGRLPRSNEPEWLDIIGVVEHQKNNSLQTNNPLAGPGREAVYIPDGQAGFGAANRWVLRTSGDPARLVPAVRAELARIDPLVPLAQVRPMREFVDEAMAPTRFTLALIAVFAAVAAVLAAVGLYGVLSTAVRQRTAEIGVRLVFGAQPRTILRLVLGQGLRLSTIGIVAGIGGALLLTRAMRTMLVGVTPTDPLTYIAIAVLFTAIAALACWIPARRAAALDPAVALREE